MARSLVALVLVTSSVARAERVPLVIARRARVEVVATGGIRIAAWLVADDRGLADGIELAPDAAVEAGSYTLVVTGLSRGTITTAVNVAITDEDAAGCAAAHPSQGIFWLVLYRLRRRAKRARVAS